VPAWPPPTTITSKRCLKSMIYRRNYDIAAGWPQLLILREGDLGR
jgi:hypothetical protein